MTVTNLSYYEALMQILSKKPMGVKSRKRATLWRLLSAKGKLSDLLLYSAVFCPPLTEIDSVVLQCLEWDDLSNSDEMVERIRTVTRKYAGDPETAQELLNHVHIRDLFRAQGQDIDENEEILLVRQIASAWQGWLLFNFPGRRFVVMVLGAEETGDNLAISFYEERNVPIARGPTK